MSSPTPRMNNDVIPFTTPDITDREVALVQGVVSSGQILSRGDATKACCKLLGDRLGGAEVVLTTSATSALELAALVMRIAPGDEVVMPSFTHVSTANAFVLRGAIPVFVDIRSDTLNMDESHLDDAITERTKALVLVHYGGIPSSVDAIAAMVRSRDVVLLEDNAQGLGGRLDDRALGTFGALSALSFDWQKAITCGEGGALIVNDTGYAEAVELARDRGTNRATFMRGDVERFEWRDLGTNVDLAEPLAALLQGQLERMDAIQASRQRIWHRYRNELHAWAVATGTQIPLVPHGAEPAYHLFTVVVPSPADRTSLQTHLREQGVESPWHFTPLSASGMGRRIGRGRCPVAEDVALRLLRLPLFSTLSDEQVDRVVRAVTTWRPL